MAGKQHALRTLALKLNVSGTIEVLDEQRLYKGSYGFIKLQIFAPETQSTSGPICTVFCTTVSELGTQKISTRNYRLLYVGTKLIDNQRYLLFETYLPKEFTATATQPNGLKITVNYCDSEVVTDDEGNVLTDEETGVPQRVATALLVSGQYSTTVYPGGWNDDSMELDISSAEAAQIAENARNIEKIFEYTGNLQGYVDDAAESAEAAAQSAEEAAESAEAAAASETAAKQSEVAAGVSEANAKKSAEAAAESAEEAAQSAAAAAHSEANAAQSAKEAAESADNLAERLGRTSIFVTELPEVGDDSYIYFVAASGGGNLFEIWIYENDEWVLLGEATLSINNCTDYTRTLYAADWEDNRQTVTINGLSTEDRTEVTVADGYAYAYVTHGISAISVIENGILFECETVPDENIVVDIVVTKEQNIPTAEGYYTINQADNLLAASADLEVDPETYIVTLTLTSRDGTVLAQPTIDLPLESVVVDIDYDEDTQSVVFTLQNGNTTAVPVGALVDGLATQTALDAAIAALEAADDELEERIKDIESGDTIVGKAAEAELAEKATSASYATKAGTADKVANPIKFVVDGEETEYDGSEGKTIEINTTTATDSEAVRYVEQSLTDSQKTQARTNIGAAQVISGQITIESAEWSSTALTAVMAVEGVTGSSIVEVAASDGYAKLVAECNIRTTAQGDNYVTFSCDTIPDSEVILNLLAINI